MMNENTKAARLRVLLIYRVMIPSIRLCGHCQLESLANRGVIEYRAAQEMSLTAEDMNWAQVVVLGRLDSWYERKLSKLFKQSGRYMIYILDDDLLNISPEVSSASYYAQPEIRDNILSMIGMSDAILTPSPLLAEKYARDGRVAIFTEEPALDPIPYAPHDPATPVKIGFAGSIDRTGDLEAMLRDALVRIRDEYGDRVSFEFFGAKPEALIEALNARHIPYCDSYDAYRQTLNDSAWDIGLAPLPVSEFNACKHYNKFCEYAAAGIVGIYSDCMPYTRIPDRERHGRFCEDSSEAWYGQIRDLIEDREAREALRKNCSACVEQLLNVEVIADKLWKDLGPLTEKIELKPVPKNILRPLKFKNMIFRFVDLWKRYGVKGILIWVKQKVLWVRWHLARIYRKFVPKKGS